jgi:hypothetical protein
MKLKFLFVPISILASIILAIWYIWPTWFNPEGIKDYQKRIAIKKCELDEANSKVGNAESLKNFLKSSDGVIAATHINDYLINEEKKENIINNINYVVGSSSVSIAGLSVENMKMDGADSQSLLLTEEKSNSKRKATISAGAQACLNDVTEKYGEIAAVDVSYLDPFASVGKSNAVPTGTEEDNQKNLTQAIKADISVVGTYKQLVVFLDNLYRMKMLNNVASIDISKESQEGEDGEAPSEYLSMKVSAYFGYLPKNGQTVLNFDDPIFERGSFDLSAIEKMSKVVSAPEIGMGETGKNNPFLP